MEEVRKATVYRRVYYEPVLGKTVLGNLWAYTLTDFVLKFVHPLFLSKITVSHKHLIEDDTKRINICGRGQNIIEKG